ncbi:MAG: hypothetical protein KDC44_06940, partial [Phaeodactylibacter sp.]|nr:hypothetical protein [Phaeodactylibacter sp.]
TSASLQTFLENLDDYTFIDITEDNLILLRYKGDILTRTSEDIFASIEAGLSGALPVTDTVWSFPLTFTDENNIEMDYDELKSGTLNYFYQNPHPEPVEVTITFPEVLTPTGDPLVLTSSCGAAVGSIPGIPFPLPTPIDLNQHILTANDDGDLTLVYEAIRQGSGIRDTLQTMYLTITDLKFS